MKLVNKAPLTADMKLARMTRNINRGGYPITDVHVIKDELTAQMGADEPFTSFAVYDGTVGDDFIVVITSELGVFKWQHISLGSLFDPVKQVVISTRCDIPERRYPLLNYFEIATCIAVHNDDGVKFSLMTDKPNVKINVKALKA